MFTQYGKANCSNTVLDGYGNQPRLHAHTGCQPLSRVPVLEQHGPVTHEPLRLQSAF